VAVDSAGNVYVADSGNNTIRKGFPALAISSSRPAFGFSGGHLGFELTGGTVGQSVVVESSPDLLNWLPIWTNMLTAPLSFSDPQSGGNSNRFYRAYTK
jgi:NHL repeat